MIQEYYDDFPDTLAVLNTVSKFSIELRKTENLAELCQVFHEQILPVFGKISCEIFILDPIQDYYVPPSLYFEHLFSINSTRVPASLSLETSPLEAIKNSLEPLFI